MQNTYKSVKKMLATLKKQGLGDVFISSIFSELIAFIVSVFIVRMFSKAEYGYYVIAYNIYGYIAVFIGCGLNNAVLQYCSERRPKNEKLSIYSFCLKYGTAFNVVLLVVMPAFAMLALDGEPRLFFLLMSGWPIIAYLSNYYIIRLRVIKDNRHFMLSNVISAAAFLVIATVLAKLLGILGYIISLYIRHALSAFLAAHFLTESQPAEGEIKLERGFKRELIRYSLVCCLTNFASAIMMLVDVTCVNIFIGDPAVVATYKTATQIPTALLFVPSSVIVFAFPYLAENNKDPIWLKNYTRKLTLGVLVINSVIAVMVFVLAPFIVRILWGERYLDAVQVLRILTVNFIITGTFNKVYGNLMIAVKKVHINLIRTVLFSCLNVILNILLIKQYGSVGAAIATLIVSCGSSIFAFGYYRYWLNKMTASENRF